MTLYFDTSVPLFSGLSSTQSKTLSWSLSSSSSSSSLLSLSSSLLLLFVVVVVDRASSEKTSNWIANKTLCTSATDSWRITSFDFYSSNRIGWVKWKQNKTKKQRNECEPRKNFDRAKTKSKKTNKKLCIHVSEFFVSQVCRTTTSARTCRVSLGTLLEPLRWAQRRRRHSTLPVPISAVVPNPKANPVMQLEHS